MNPAHDGCEDLCRVVSCRGQREQTLVPQPRYKPTSSPGGWWHESDENGSKSHEAVMPVPACMRDCVKVVVDRVVLCHFSSILPTNTGRDGI